MPWASVQRIHYNTMNTPAQGTVMQLSHVVLITTAFPEAFCHPPVPLKMGMRRDLQAALAELGVEDADALAGGFLAGWCNRPEYARLLVAGAQRVNLAGEPVGVVSETQSEAARLKLARLEVESAAVDPTGNQPPALKLAREVIVARDGRRALLAERRKAKKADKKARKAARPPQPVKKVKPPVKQPVKQPARKAVKQAKTPPVKQPVKAPAKPPVIIVKKRRHYTSPSE